MFLRTRYNTIKMFINILQFIQNPKGIFLGEIINELIPDVFCSLKKGHLKHTMTSEIQNKNKKNSLSLAL